MTFTQPTTKQVQSVNGAFTSVIDATEGVSVYNVQSIFGGFTSVIDATDTAAPPTAGTSRSFGAIF
jgi:hypothetical protein